MGKTMIAHLFAHLVPRFGNEGALPAMAQRQGRFCVWARPMPMPFRPTR